MNQDLPTAPTNERVYLPLAERRLGVRRLAAGEPGGPKLLGFPYAGGQSLAFRPLAARMPRHWQFWAVDLPGHGWSQGPPLSSIEAMSELVLSNVPAEIIDGAFLLGHSMGGCVAFQTAQKLVSTQRPPAGLILSATRPPHLNDEYRSFLALDEQALLTHLIALGGVPAEWASHPEIFAPFRAALRGDFEAFEAYEPRGCLETVPVLAVGATADAVCRPEHVLEWSRHCRRLRWEWIAAGHLYLHTHPELLAPRLEAFIAELDSTGEGRG